MVHEIGTCIWFEQQAREAALFYESVFNDFELIAENPLALEYRLLGRRFIHLNGAKGQSINPSISFFVNMESEAELRSTWAKLTEGGSVLMPLNTYPWSALYGWCADRYGVNWQLMQGHQSQTPLVPSLMFNQRNAGKAEAAINGYTSLFPESGIIAISRYEKEDPDVEGTIKYSQFLLNKVPFTAMDSSGPHQFFFNEAISLFVAVDTQEEIDQLWDQLTDGGTPGQCGWLKDRYGVSWQIIPSVLGALLQEPDKSAKVTAALLKMQKIIIDDLVQAGR